MRNFEERKAEIFRRSESRIKERKRRHNRIITMCIPLCLIVTIFLLTFLPNMLTIETNNAFELLDTKNENNSIPMHNFTQIDIKGTGENAQYHKIISDTQSMNDVYQQIYTILIPYESYNDIIGDGCEELKDYISDIKASSYIITFTNPNGIKRTFILSDNKLNDAQLNIEVELSDKQIHALKSTLKLSD